jgi:hypothetical protein
VAKRESIAESSDKDGCPCRVKRKNEDFKVQAEESEKLKNPVKKEHRQISIKQSRDEEDNTQAKPTKRTMSSKVCRRNTLVESTKRERCDVVLKQEHCHSEATQDRCVLVKRAVEDAGLQIVKDSKKENIEYPVLEREKQQSRTDKSSKRDEGHVKPSSQEAKRRKLAKFPWKRPRNSFEPEPPEKKLSVKPKIESRSFAARHTQTGFSADTPIVLDSDPLEEVFKLDNGNNRLTDQARKRRKLEKFLSNLSQTGQKKSSTKPRIKPKSVSSRHAQLGFSADFPVALDSARLGGIGCLDFVPHA